MTVLFTLLYIIAALVLMKITLYLDTLILSRGKRTVLFLINAFLLFGAAHVFHVVVSLTWL